MSGPQTQKVLLKFKLKDCFDYKVVEVMGNCSGLSVIETAIEFLYGALPEDADGYVHYIYGEHEDAAAVYDDEGLSKKKNKKMLVQAEIIDKSFDEYWAAATTPE
mgnify:CR=1 FL=1